MTMRKQIPQQNHNTRQLRSKLQKLTTQIKIRGCRETSFLQPRGKYETEVYHDALNAYLTVFIAILVYYHQQAYIYCMLFLF